MLVEFMVPGFGVFGALGAIFWTSAILLAGSYLLIDLFNFDANIILLIAAAVALIISIFFG